MTINLKDRYLYTTPKTWQTTVYATSDGCAYQASTIRSFSRNATNKIVTDSATCIMLEDISHVSNTTLNWADTTNCCDDLVLGGYSDWGLPNPNKFLTLFDFCWDDFSYNNTNLQRIDNANHNFTNPR